MRPTSAMSRSHPNTSKVGPGTTMLMAHSKSRRGSLIASNATGTSRDCNHRSDVKKPPYNSQVGCVKHLDDDNKQTSMLTERQRLQVTPQLLSFSMAHSKMIDDNTTTGTSLRTTQEENSTDPMIVEPETHSYDTQRETEPSIFDVPDKPPAQGEIVLPEEPDTPTTNTEPHSLNAEQTDHAASLPPDPIASPSFTAIFAQSLPNPDFAARELFAFDMDEGESGEVIFEGMDFALESPVDDDMDGVSVETTKDGKKSSLVRKNRDLDLVAEAARRREKKVKMRKQASH